MMLKCTVTASGLLSREHDSLFWQEVLTDLVLSVFKVRSAACMYFGVVTAAGLIDLECIEVLLHHVAFAAKLPNTHVCRVGTWFRRANIGGLG
eukprot:6126937-Amphidinium_carterae.1